MNKDLAQAACLAVLLFVAPAIAAAEASVPAPSRPAPSAPAALIEPTGAAVGIRAGDHPGFGRIVFDLPKGATVESVIEGSRVLLVFAGAPRLGEPGVLPHNLASLQVDGTTATLTILPGSRVRQQRLRDRLVLDLLDAAAPPREDADKAAAARAQVKSSQARTDAPAPVIEPSSSAPGPSLPGRTISRAPVIQDAGSPPSTNAETAPVVPVQSTALPASGSQPVIQPAIRQEAPPAAAPVLLPADSTVGAAAFRRGDWGIVVLDRRLTLPVPAGLPGAIVNQGVVSTVLLVRMQSGQALSLERGAAGWSVSIGIDPSPGVLTPQPLPDGVAFPMRKIGRAVTILDPATGGALLVGTSLVAGQEAAVALERRTPAFTILSTWLGIAVEPVSDQVDLHAGSTAFALRGGGIAPDRLTTASTGRLDLPNEPVPALLNRLQAQLASAAGAPPRARSHARLAAVQAMLALGLGVEAQALVQKAVADDPEAASDAKVLVAGGVAAVIAGRLDETSALDKPELADDPELDLWRGIRDRRLGRETESVRRLPSHLTLADSYPRPLRRLIRPDLAEAAAENGVPMPADDTTPYAAALALEHANKIEEAIAAWQAVASGTNRRDQVRATIRATELQLAAGRIGPAEAADIMERQAYAWRGDAQELASRLRAAELRQAAGDWRAALDFLRATDALFPDDKDAIRAHKASVFEAMLSADGARLRPLDVVLLAADYADCVPDGGQDTRLARLLADKLMALDLPARAIPVLQGLVKGTQAGPARTEFGLRLGQLLLDGGDAAGAMLVLQASDAPELSTEVLESRGLLSARIQAAQGHPKEAAASLEAFHSSAADDLRASLLGQSGDWKGSLDALSALATKTFSPDGVLSTASQALVIREATAAVQSHDPDQLRRIGQLAPRMSGTAADMLRMLTEPAITSTSELPRAKTELMLARAIPKQIQSFTPP